MIDVSKLKALSIRQPWAWAICHAGKDVENRDWHRGNWWLDFRGPVLIHASKSMTKAEYEAFTKFVDSMEDAARFPAVLGLPSLDDLPRGGIVGYAEITGVITRAKSPWFFGPYGLVLKNVRPLPFMSCKGALGFFDPKLSAHECFTIQKALAA